MTIATSEFEHKRMKRDLILVTSLKPETIVAWSLHAEMSIVTASWGDRKDEPESKSPMLSVGLSRILGQS